MHKVTEFLIVISALAASAAVVNYYFLLLPQQEQKKLMFELDERCEHQAHEQFKIGGFDKKQTAFFVSHYNDPLHKCFVMFEDDMEETARHDGSLMTTKTLLDANEGKPYGIYMWDSGIKKVNGTAEPFECSVWLPNGEKKNCHSSEEFDDLVSVYLPFNDRK